MSSRVLPGVLLVLCLFFSCSGGEKDNREKSVTETEIAEIDDEGEEEEVERLVRPSSVHKVAPITEELRSKFRKFEKDLIENDGYDWEEKLSSMILDNPATLYYPFDSLGGVYVETSSDGCFRAYTWDNGNGGTMISWSNIFQYRYEDSVYANYSTLTEILYQDECWGTSIDDIFTFKCKDGKTVYLLVEYLRESSTLGYRNVTPIVVENGNLKKLESFITTRGEEVVGDEYNIPEWFFNANYGEGWSWLFTYDKKNEDLYAFTTDDGSITDQYDVYHFNGRNLVYKETTGGFWLHPSIRTFKHLVSLFQTDDYRVRVDKMKDGRYRYASWKRPKKMSDAPDIVLYSRIQDENTMEYVFKTTTKDGNFTYVAKHNEWLRVEKNGNVIYKGNAQKYQRNW